LAGSAVAVHLMAAGSPALAFFHTWRFTEFFSSADGSVQFIELGTTFNNEHFSQGSQIKSISTGKTFTFPSNLSTSLTANKKLLIATPGFSALPGAVTPDFTLPSTSFFNPAGDTVQLVNIDSRTFPNVPIDGVMSRVYPSNTTATNSPTNFTGASGSLNLAPPASPADFNGDGDVDSEDLDKWSDDFGETAGSDADDDGDSDGADFLAWQEEFDGFAAGAAVPEPATLALAGVGVWQLVGLHRRGRKRRTPCEGRTRGSIVQMSPRDSRCYDSV
jgi:hypothetical protein